MVKLETIKRDEKNMEKMFLDVEGLAKLMGISQTTIYKWVSEKFIPHYKIGAAIRFDKDEVLGWAKKRGSNGRKRTENVNQYV